MSQYNFPGGWGSGTFPLHFPNQTFSYDICSGQTRINGQPVPSGSYSYPMPGGGQFQINGGGFGGTQNNGGGSGGGPAVSFQQGHDYYSGYGAAYQHGYGCECGGKHPQWMCGQPHGCWECTQEGGLGAQAQGGQREQGWAQGPSRQQVPNERPQQSSTGRTREV